MIHYIICLNTKVFHNILIKLNLSSKYCITSFQLYMPHSVRGDIHVNITFIQLKLTVLHGRHSLHTTEANNDLYMLITMCNINTTSIYFQYEKYLFTIGNIIKSFVNTNQLSSSLIINLAQWVSETRRNTCYTFHLWGSFSALTPSISNKCIAITGVLYENITPVYTPLAGRVFVNCAQNL